jgi:serine/threonine-protein kinase
MGTDPAAEASEQELVSRWLGKTIKDKYVVENVIGSGGMAVVYAARHRNGKRFAVKMLHRELSLNAFIRQRFLREGYVANRVEHPGAVAIIDDDVTDDGSAFLVMELLQGATIEAIWQGSNHRLPLECVLAIAEQLLDVLSHAHAQNVVHRDLKPANMFLTRDGSVKVLDFGIARLHESTDSSRTESGTTLGTPLFMPPEQASGRSRDVDARTDLWAVGATMFSLLSGQYVHDGENATQVLISAATCQARSFTTAMAGAHPAIVALIDKALAFDGADRWDSAIAMRDAILAAHESVFGTSISRDVLKALIRDAVVSTGKGEISGVAPTEQAKTPSTPTGQGPHGTQPIKPKRATPAPLPARTPARQTPAPLPAMAISNQGAPPRSAALVGIVVGIGLFVALVCGAGAIWFVHSRATASTAVVPVSPIVAMPAGQPSAVVAIAPQAPAVPAATVTTTPAIPVTSVGALPQAPAARRPGAGKGRPAPTGSPAQPEVPAVAPLPPPPQPTAETPQTPQSKANPTPVIDRSNPFN